ncbi:MAG: hypothetical protein E6767_15595 [Dysgonomonas sp.]|nr:hypothetical protein [Dysgonomonas sp.]
MKTSVFKLICSVFAATFIMSSCLGDGEGSYEAKRELVYITTVNGSTVAATSAGYVYHSDLNSLSPGRCYYIGYKIKSGAGSGIYQAESIALLEDGEPLPQKALNVTEAGTDGVTTTSFATGGFYADNYFGDRWLFNYTVSLKAGEETEAYFYYDPNDQKEDGEDLAANRVIIDVRIRKLAEIPGEGKETKKTIEAIGDLSALRTNYAPTYDSDKDYVPVFIKFRYVKYNDKNEPVKTLLGSWSENASNVCYMYFKKD